MGLTCDPKGQESNNPIVDFFLILKTLTIYCQYFHSTSSKNKIACCSWQKYTCEVLQTVQMNRILLCV